MDLREIEKFRIIGACTKMQKISLEEEYKLIDGIIYDIDFAQDYSEIYWNGNLLNDIPISDIIDAVVHPKETYCCDPYIDENRRSSQEFWASIDKIEKKERRMAEKWKKRRPKNQKEAYENFERVSKRFE